MIPNDYKNKLPEFKKIEQPKQKQLPSTTEKINAQKGFSQKVNPSVIQGMVKNLEKSNQIGVKIGLNLTNALKRVREFNNHLKTGIKTLKKTTSNAIYKSFSPKKYTQGNSKVGSRSLNRVKFIPDSTSQHLAQN